jgi:hypothetical protein
MTECEDRVYMRGLRVAGGFPCRAPAKWRLVPPARLGWKPMLVCGRHVRLGMYADWVKERLV